MPIPFSHCSFCGAAYPRTPAGDLPDWPRRCGQCGNASYRNPLPVAVALVPVATGILTVRRSIPPKIGELALPGGFMEIGEQWQDAVARELFEETGIRSDSTQISFFSALSSPGGHLLIFGRCQALTELPHFRANQEVSELVVVDQPIELAFPLHTQALHEILPLR
jgi:ADP-ribose pyrophosphatase YjhB (NUDIX family)